MPVPHLRRGDCRDVLPELGAGWAHAVVCDPPYGLSKEPDIAEVMTHWLNGDDYTATGGGFMGKSWDSFVPGPATWRAIFDAMQPGGHLVAFAGTRTLDLMSISIRMAGFEVRDTLMWMHGQGFPKSLDVPAAIAKTDTGPESPAPEAAQWDGWGTALKPAWEPIILARKPLRVDGRKATVAANVLAHRAGALNVDACRVDLLSGERTGGGAKMSRTGAAAVEFGGGYTSGDGYISNTKGRWPANVVLAHHEDCVAGPGLEIACRPECPAAQLAEASRFFFCSKASSAERNDGLPDGLTNRHPTVKPVALMAYLVRLVTPPGGIVLDPFCGSGTTGVACAQEGVEFVGVDRDDEGTYLPVARARIAAASRRRRGYAG